MHRSPDKQLPEDQFAAAVQEMRDGRETQEAILQAVQDLNPRNTGDQVTTDKAGIRNYATQAIDVDTALTDSMTVISPPTYRLTFTEWPAGLTVLGVKINDPGAQSYNVLESGNVIESDVPIGRIFVTTSPDSQVGVVKVLGGNLQIFPRNVCACYDSLPFEVKDGNESISQNLAELPTVPTLLMIQKQRTGAQSDNLITNIPSGIAIRIALTMTSLLKYDGVTEGNGTYKLKTGGLEALQWNFDITETDTVFKFDTGWISLATAVEGSTFEQDIAALGPAGNKWRVNIHLWIVP